MRSDRRRLAATLLGITALVVPLLAGCGSDTSATGANPSTSTTSGYPVTISASGGPVTLPARPHRIVSLSPTATEMLYAIGAGGQVTAVDSLSDYPKQAPRTKLSAFKPNAEAVIKHKPDLVVLSNDQNGIVKALRKVKIPVLLEPAATSLSDAYGQIDQLGAATGHARKAATVVSGMKKKIASIVAATKKPKKHPTYYYELDNHYYTATSKTFIGRVLGLFGLRNIADSADKQHSGYPKLSAEYVLKADPDLVLLADTSCCQQTATTVAKRPGWDKMTAVTGHHVIALNDDIASRWGPRIVTLVRTVSRAVAKLSSR